MLALGVATAFARRAKFRFSTTEAIDHRLRGRAVRIAVSIGLGVSGDAHLCTNGGRAHGPGQRCRRRVPEAFGRESPADRAAGVTSRRREGMAVAIVAYVRVVTLVHPHS